jgi:uncharacterized protein YbbK (DUF523 family)
VKLVSACLVGIKCAFDGKCHTHPKLLEEFEKGELFPVCPEVLGGLPIPRPPSEIQQGDGDDVLEDKADVRLNNGLDVTSNFVRGAHETMRVAKAVGAKEAIFRVRSPSCGCGLIYDGSFSGKLRKGDGVTAAALRSVGIKVISDEDY